MPDNFLSSSRGKKIKKQWEGAQEDQDIQECLDSMIPELLQQLHGCEPDKSRPTYNNASGGAPSKHDCPCRKDEQV